MYMDNSQRAALSERYEYNRSRRVGVIVLEKRTVDNLVPTNPSGVIAKDSVHPQRSEAFRPGDALIAYRKGEAVDWEALAKKYGGAD